MRRKFSASATGAREWHRYFRGGKLAVYTAAAGIDPARVIAVNLDVGTDNEALLNDPAYLGNRHARVSGKAYDDFIDLYLKTASSFTRMPCCILKISAPATPAAFGEQCR